MNIGKMPRKLKAFVVATGLVGPDAPAIRQARAKARDLPELSLTLTRSASGMAMRRHLRTRVLGLRTHQALSVLTLPKTASSYLKGRNRQALRTNITKADRLGVTARILSAEELKPQVDRMLARGQDLRYLDRLLAEHIDESMEDWMAVSREGDPIAFARVQVNLDVAFLKYMIATEDCKSSGCRYKLSADLFMSLAQRGVRYVIVGSTFGLDPGLRYFQERLGFEPVRAKIRLRKGWRSHSRIMPRFDDARLAM